MNDALAVGELQPAAHFDADPKSLFKGESAVFSVGDKCLNVTTDH